MCLGFVLLPRSLSSILRLDKAANFHLAAASFSSLYQSQLFTVLLAGSAAEQLLTDGPGTGDVLEIIGLAYIGTYKPQYLI